MSVWKQTTIDTINNVYGPSFHPFAKSKRFRDSDVLPSADKARRRSSPSVVNKSERVVASKVVMEVDSPSTYSGRVALLGHGQCPGTFLLVWREWFPTSVLSLQPLIPWRRSLAKVRVRPSRMPPSVPISYAFVSSTVPRGQRGVEQNARLTPLYRTCCRDTRTHVNHGLGIW